MAISSSTPSKRLYILHTDLSNHGTGKPLRGQILTTTTSPSAKPSSPAAVIDNLPSVPDGIAIDHAAGHIYYTNMGAPFTSPNGSISRANLDGSNVVTILGTPDNEINPSDLVGLHTPKQITLAGRSRKLYWCDREGMKVCRANLDGTELEVLADSSEGQSTPGKDQTRWCVGIAVDEERAWFYWTQKGPSKGGKGRIFRARIAQPEQREVVLEGLPEPIDLEVVGDMLYWTDRGDPPKGNSLNRIRIPPAIARREDADVSRPLVEKSEVEVLTRRLHETIGLAVDEEEGKVYVTDLAGGVYKVDIKTGEKTVLFPELGDLTGIALA